MSRARSKERHTEGSPYWNWVQRHGGLEPVENNPDHLAAPAAAEESREAQRLREFIDGGGIAQWTEMERRVFSVHLMHGNTVRETARRLSVWPVQVQRVKLRVLAKLRAVALGTTATADVSAIEARLLAEFCAERTV